MPKLPTFRLASESDVGELVALIAEFYCEEGISFDENITRRAIAELLQNPSLGQIWMVERGATPGGYFVLIFSFILEFGGRQAFLDEIYLRPIHRDQGWGRRTLQFAEELCARAGITILRLEVDRANARAIRFYQAAAFEMHDRATMTKLLPRPTGREGHWA